MDLEEFQKLYDPTPEDVRKAAQRQIPSHVKTLADFVAWTSKRGRGKGGKGVALDYSKKENARSTFEERHGVSEKEAEKEIYDNSCFTDNDIADMVSGMSRDDSIDFIWDVLKECDK